MRKSLMSLLGIMLSMLTAQGVVITDDFNRLDTGYSADASLIGSGWVNAAPSDSNNTWRINNGTLEFDGTVSFSLPGILYNTETTLNGAWTFSCDITLREDYGWNGFVLYKDTDNYTFLQMMKRSSDGSKAAALIQCIDGVTGSTLWLSGSITEADDYTVVFESNGSGVVSCNVYELGQSTAVAYRTLTSQDFDGYYAGLRAGNYNKNPDVAYDNFSVTVIPEPGTVNLLVLSTVGIFISRRIAKKER
ncbi:MAG: hypothetical protein AB7E95_07240 [Kiritimatiellales bacterium]